MYNQIIKDNDNDKIVRFTYLSKQNFSDPEIFALSKIGINTNLDNNEISSKTFRKIIEELFTEENRLLNIKTQLKSPNDIKNYENRLKAIKECKETLLKSYTDNRLTNKNLNLILENTQKQIVHLNFARHVTAKLLKFSFLQSTGEKNISNIKNLVSNPSQEYKK